MQDFCPRINMHKGIFFKQSYNELWFVKKCQNCTFKVNFPCQKLTEFFQKKNYLRISIQETIFCKKHFFSYFKKVPKLYFQCQFSMPKIDRIFSKKNSFIISIYETIFCKKHFFLTSILESFYFLKSCPIFDEL